MLGMDRDSIYKSFEALSLEMREKGDEEFNDDVIRQIESQLECIRHLSDKNGQKEKLLALIDEIMMIVKTKQVCPI